jgi:hypothetical protein
LVAPSVVDMSYQRLAYDDADTAGQMHDDCTAIGDSLALPRQRTPENAVEILPVVLEVSRDTKPQIEVSEAAAYLASRLHLHLD